MSDITQSTAPEAPAGTNRRLVLKSSLMTMAALGTGAVTNAASASTLTDADILNFALNLEYLEAEFYLRAVFGHGLSADATTGTGNHGKVTGGNIVPFKNSAVAAYATEIAQDEQNHVLYLRKALGSSAVSEPTIDLKTSFNTLAKAAGLGDTFDPFASEENFLLGAFIFEDVGVTAYHGAAGAITNKTTLAAAAGILAVEAYHAGVIRVLCYQQGLASSANKVSALRNSLSKAAGATSITDQGIVMNGNVNLVPAYFDSSIAYSRMPDTVLNIVYAGGQSGNFGFFPNHVNGNIQ